MNRSIVLASVGTGAVTLGTWITVGIGPAAIIGGVLVLMIAMIEAVAADGGC